MGGVRTDHITVGLRWGYFFSPTTGHTAWQHTYLFRVIGIPTYIQQVYLQHTYIQQVYLKHTCLQHTCLQHTCLQHTCLQHTYLQHTYLPTYLQHSYQQHTYLFGGNRIPTYLQHSYLFGDGEFTLKSKMYAYVCMDGFQSYQPN